MTVNAPLPRLMQSVSESRMLDRVLSEHRGPVAGALLSLVSLALLLWLIRGPRPIWASVPFLAVSSLLVAIAYFGVYGILYFSARIQRIPAHAFRTACGFFFFVAAAFLTGSTLFALYQFLTHRPVPAANLVALGAALGAMKAWNLQSAAHEQ